MATFLIQSIDGDLPLYSGNKKDKAIKRAEQIRLSGTPCYIEKLFSKARHPYIARIEYFDNLDAWLEESPKPI